ncbi:MAG: sulfatase-like hydrolase/transferase, partial [Saprospiraceae bacterium]|nr:sulfatase-like hydrolase/transferase [Saprospiraceae bacterium]
ADSDLDRHIAMVEYVDKITGEIVSALEELNLGENTLVLWTTDNGTTGQVTGTQADRKIKGGKSKTLESGICVPFIANWSDHLSSGTTSDALIDFTDLFPTILDLAGIYPGGKIQVGGSSQVIDGHSFKAVLLGEGNDAARQWIMSMGGGNYARLTADGVENQYTYRDRVMRNKRYKIYIDGQGEPEKFFDLRNDPFEESNLIHKIDSLDLRGDYNQLLAVLNKFPNRDSDPRYKPNPAQAWDVAITAESEVWKK